MIFFFDEEFAERRCSVNGSWEGRGKNGDFYSPNGWTNYTPCFTTEMLMLIRKLYAGNEEAAKVNMTYFHNSVT